MVDERAEYLNLSNRVKKYPLAKTHFNINKFGKPTEEEFLLMRDIIKKIIKHAYKQRKSASLIDTDSIETNRSNIS
jgi:hypothetical protein